MRRKSDVFIGQRVAVSVAALILTLVSCAPGPSSNGPGSGIVATRVARRTLLGRLDNRIAEVVFEGGRIEFELYSRHDRVYQVALNHYRVPVLVHWTISRTENLRLNGPIEGVTLLPAASPDREPTRFVLAELRRIDRSKRYFRYFDFHAQFGDPRARPTAYVYALPYPRDHEYSVIQGFQGRFSHHGPNAYAVDIDCPLGTPVLAARPGLVVATHATARGSGTTPHFQELERSNFVFVLHDDGTLAEYLHLENRGVDVEPGQWVDRGEQLGLSGNSGYSTGPHLHFRVMTAAEGGRESQSFPFSFEVTPGVVVEPAEGQSYKAWE